MMRFDGALSRAGFSTIWLTENRLPLRSPMPITHTCAAARPPLFDGNDIRVLGEIARRIDHLREAAAVVLHQHVGQQQRKRLVPHQFARAPHRVAESQRHLLAREARRSRTGQVAHEQLEIGPAFGVRERVLELELRSKWSSMTALLRPVTKMKCSMPASRASSTTCWISGRSTTGNISFGMALVAGRNLVPSPATGRRLCGSLS